MTGISKISEKLKKKMSFDDYAISEEAPKIHTLKTTVYLPESVNRMLNDLFARRSEIDSKVDRLSLICEAIKLLYDQER